MTATAAIAGFNYCKERELDPACFEQVVVEYSTRIYKFIFQLVNEAELARDLTQDVFVAAYKDLLRRAADDTEPQTPHHMSAWLYAIARNRALGELRRRKIVSFTTFWHKSEEGEEEFDGLARSDLSEEDNNLERQVILKDQLQEALQQVDRKKLTYLLLRLEGFSYQEISEMTDTSIANVKVNIFRARETLRKVFAE